MRYGPEHKKRTHDRIVADAARLFRDRGYQGCGVDEVMAAAGLTAGGFYSHFKDKDALLAEVVAHCFATDTAAAGGPGTGGAAAGSIADWADAYLSERHRDAPGSGCPIPTLAADVARQGPGVRGAFTSVLRGQVAGLAERVPSGTSIERTDAAIRVLAAAAGAMLLARAVDDPELSDRILRVVRASLKSAADVAVKRRRGTASPARRRASSREGSGPK